MALLPGNSLPEQLNTCAILMSLVSIKERLVFNVQTHGLSDTVLDLVYRVLNHLTSLMVLKCIMIDVPDPCFLSSDNGYSCQFLAPKRLMDLSNNPEYQLEREFLSEAISKGDDCFAILDGDRLASYGWYSNKPTRISPELELRFDKRYIYMYNGFTHPDYRGQRLHATGMTMALNHYLNKGYKGIVSWVEVNNLNSLRSCYRMGYRSFGEIIIVKLFHHHLILSRKGCRDYDFKVSAVG